MFKNMQFKEIFTLFWPIAMAMFLTSILSLIDSVMISGYDLDAISAISVATQTQFFFGPIYFGILTGVNVFSVQYYARNEVEHLKKFAGIALSLLIPLALINFITLTFFAAPIVASYVEPSSTVYTQALDYISIFKFSILLVPLDMFFMYQYRAIKKPKIALYMNASQAILNIIFNYFLIYGNGPFDAMGIQGAALGTLLARIITLVINIYVAYKLQAPFFGKFSEMFSYNSELFFKIFKNTLPLILVELAFGVGNIINTQFYASAGVEAFTAFNVAKTISFTINAFVIATANVSGILIGSAISKEVSKEKLRECSNNIFSFIFMCSIIIMLLSVVILPLFIPFFGVEDTDVKLVSQLLFINGIWMAIRVYSSSFIAIIKSGNDNKFVMIIEIGATYLIAIPVMYILSNYFDASILALRSVIILDALFKLILGLIRYKQRKWIVKL